MADRHQSDDVVVAEGLFKIFGRSAERAVPKLRAGLSKEALFEQTGLTVGVQNASFSVRSGEIFVLMGLSGSGKSTLLRLINRLIEPTAGTVRIGGRDVTQMARRELIALRRQEITMVFQSFALLPNLKVWENAAFGLAIAGVPRAARRARALQALEQVGLQANADSYPAALSGGMQQRVGLARALAVDPSILLMDEAFSALDPLIRTEMQDDLLALQRERQQTVLFVSHDLDEAMRIGDRIAIMQGGSIVQIGTPEELLAHPANAYVHSFFRGVDIAAVYHAADVVEPAALTVEQAATPTPAAALETLREHHEHVAFVLSADKTLLGTVTAASLERAINTHASTLGHAYTDAPTVRADAPLRDIIGAVAGATYPVAVVDAREKFVGAISHAALLRALVPQ